MRFKCISTHPEDLADGRVVAPGEIVELSREQTEDPHNAALLADEKFLGLSSTAKSIVNEREEEGDSA